MELSILLKKLRLDNKITLDDLSSYLSLNMNIIKFLEGEKILENFYKKDILFSLKKYSKFFKVKFSFLKKLYYKNIFNNYSLSKNYFTNSLDGLKLLRYLFLFTVCFSLVFYITYQIKIRYSKPYLEVYYPQDNFNTNEREIIVKGKTQKNSILKINNEDVFTSSGGDFSKKLFLNKGLNFIKITSNQDNGGQNIVLRKILLQEKHSISKR